MQGVEAVKSCGADKRANVPAASNCPVFPTKDYISNTRDSSSLSGQQPESPSSQKVAAEGQRIEAGELP